jgi:hypothetical protein
MSTRQAQHVAQSNLREDRARTAHPEGARARALGEEAYTAGNPDYDLANGSILNEQMTVTELYHANIS